jgi:hypothetical protein
MAQFFHASIKTIIMKKSIIIFTLLFLSISVHSQVHFGLRAGLSSSQVNINETVNGLKITTGDNTFGYHVGVFTQFIFKEKWILMPEALFTSSGGDIDLSDGTSFNEVWNLSYNRLDIPVTLGYKFLKVFRLQAGLVPSILLKADARNDDVSQDVKDNYKNATWGYQAGVGFDFWLLVLDLKYQGSFSSVHNANIPILGSESSYSPDTRVNMWILSVGVRLF